MVARMAYQKKQILPVTTTPTTNHNRPAIVTALATFPIIDQDTPHPNQEWQDACIDMVSLSLSPSLSLSLSLSLPLSLYISLSLSIYLSQCVYGPTGGQSRPRHSTPGSRWRWSHLPCIFVGGCPSLCVCVFLEK